jgi:MFS family permease
LLAGLGRANLLLAVPLVIGGAALMWPALHSLLPAGTMRAKAGLPAAMAMMGLLNLGFFGVEAYIPLALTSIRDQTASFAGVALTAATISWTSGAWLQAHAAHRQSRRFVTQIGLVLIVIGIVLSSLVLIQSTPVYLMIVAWGVAGLGIGLAFSSGTLVVFETAPKGEEGAATSSMQIMNVLGVSLGAGIGGVIVNSFSSGDDPTRLSLVLVNITMIVVIVLCFVAASRMPSRPKPKVEEIELVDEPVLVEA